MAGFRSPRAEARFRSAQLAAMRRWPAPRQAFEVATEFGASCVVRYGPTEADGANTGGPFLLLNGKAGHLAQWYPNVPALGARHPVYAVDTLGEAGLGRVTRTPRTPADLVRWLEQLLAALDLTDVHLAGRSYGGWLALHYAARATAPNRARIASLHLLDPAGLAPIPPRFIAWMAANGALALTPHALRNRLALPMRNAMLREQEVLRVCVSGALGHRTRMPFPHELPAEALIRAASTVPAQFLLAEHTLLHDSRAQLARLHTLVPEAQAEIVPGTGHALANDAPLYINARMLKFAAERAA
jgi:pimeloyl-ACP methyl ester carboxylesterase